MFDQYSYKVKFKALLVVFTLLAVTSYKRSLNTLIQVIKEHKTLSEKIDSINAKSKSSASLKKEIALLDNYIGKEGNSKEATQQSVLSFVSQNHPEVSVFDLQAIHVFEDQNFQITTNQLDITGNVNQVLAVVYDFEKNFNLSRIISVNFYTNKKNNKSEVLHSKIIFQNYENNK